MSALESWQQKITEARTAGGHLALDGHEVPCLPDELSGVCAGALLEVHGGMAVIRLMMAPEREYVVGMEDWETAGPREFIWTLRMTGKRVGIR